MKFPLKLCLATCKILFKYKIFLGEDIFGKEKYFQVFSCILNFFFGKIFSGVWLYSENAIFLLISHIFSTSKQILQ